MSDCIQIAIPVYITVKVTDGTIPGYAPVIDTEQMIDRIEQDASRFFQQSEDGLCEALQIGLGRVISYCAIQPSLRMRTETFIES